MSVNRIYENGVLKCTLVEGGYVEGSNYFFYLNDHLGNNRLVVQNSITGGKVVQKNHYYPFGMTFAETSDVDQNVQRYKYNGKELDRTMGLNLYDYGARYYDPAIGRFTTMDPLAEKYYSWSPYGYCMGNPMRFVDPQGEDIFDAVRGFFHGLIGHDLTKPTSLQSYTTDIFAAKTYARSQGDNLERVTSGNRSYDAGYTTGKTAAFVADIVVGYITGQKVISAAKEGVESYISKRSGTSLVNAIPKRSLSNDEARSVYNKLVKGINTNLAPTEINAKFVVSQRNELKTAVRDMMRNQNARKELDINNPVQPFEYYYKKYYNQGLRGGELYKEIMNKGVTTNKDVNKMFGY